MTSGMGVKGTQGRCYGFFADLKECQEIVRTDLKESKEPISVKRVLVDAVCDPHRMDYFECLHGEKQNRRTQIIIDELNRQEREARYGKPSDKQH